MDTSPKDKGVWPSGDLPPNWTWAPMSLVFNNETSSDRKLKQRMYLSEGRIAVIDQGQELVGGYTNDENIAYTGELPIIIFGDHTRCVKYIDFPFAQGADGVKVLSPSSLVDPKFSYHSLLAVSLPDKGYSRHFKFLKETQFPIPPLPEQYRITEKIESLQSRSSKARNALEIIPPLLEKFRQSVLSSAFRGDLTADWRAQNPDIEPAEKLLERIRKKRRKRWEENELAKMKAKGKTPKDDKWKKKYKEPEPVDTTDLPELPEGWCWARFGEIASVDSNLVDPKTLPNLPHIAPNHIETLTGRLLEYKTVQEDGVISAKHLFRSGHILYSKIRPYLAKAVIVDFEGVCSADMYPISTDLNEIYLHSWIISPMFTAFAIFEQGRTVLPKINQKDLGTLSVPVAPLGEQDHIAKMLLSYTKVKDKIAKKAAIVLDAFQKLDQSILAKAFRGELVPQDPNDEPASHLLKRIKQEKTSLEAEKKKRGKVGLKKVTRKKEATAMAKKKERRSLVEVLQPHSSGLSSEELFQQAGFDEHLVDEFYAELKNEVVSGNIIEDRPDRERVILRLNAA